MPGPAFILRIAGTRAQDGAPEHRGQRGKEHVESAAGTDADWHDRHVTGGYTSKSKEVDGRKEAFGPGGR